MNVVSRPGPSLAAGIPRPWAGISPVVPGGGGTAELVIEQPGEWSFAPAYDAGGASVREVRADGAPRWVFVIDSISALTVRMSDGADRANVVVNGLLPFTVNGGGGTDRLSVGVPGGAPIADSGSEGLLIKQSGNCGCHC